MSPSQFIPLETMLLDPEWEIWQDVGHGVLLTYLALRAAHQQYTHSEGRKGQSAIRAKHDQTYFESEKRLGRRVGLSESTIKRYTPLLARIGLLEIVERGRKGRPNRYRMPMLTLPLLERANRHAKVLAAQAGQPDPQCRSERPLVEVSLTPSAGQRDLRTISEIYTGNGEEKSRRGDSLTEEQGSKRDHLDGAFSGSAFSPQGNEGRAGAEEARRFIQERVRTLATAKGVPAVGVSSRRRW